MKRSLSMDSGFLSSITHHHRVSLFNNSSFLADHVVAAVCSRRDGVQRACTANPVNALPVPMRARFMNGLEKLENAMKKVGFS